MIMDTISASQIQSYLMCALKYRFRYVDGLPAPWKSTALAFGTSVHAALAWWHEKLMAGERPEAEAVTRIFEADWEAQQDAKIRFKDGETHESLRTQGSELVRLYLEKMQKVEVWAAEQPFETPIIHPETGEVLDFKLRGYFDLLTKDGGIVEIKTAARAYTPDQLERQVQLSAYSYAYRQVYGRNPHLSVVALLKQKTPKIQTYQAYRLPDGDLWFAGLALDVRRAVEHEVFPPNPGWSCSDCEYGLLCRDLYKRGDHENVSWSPDVAKVA